VRFTAKAALAAAGLVVARSLLRRRAEPGPGTVGPAAPAPVPVPAEPAPASDAAAGSVEGYCMKERKRVQVKHPVRTTTKDGRPAVRGTCPDCGSKIFRFLPQG
jgi:hypothetical protein